VTSVRNPECKDCKAERERRGEPYPKQPRPVKPGTGGRCHTHGVQRRREAKSNTHERRVRKVYGLAPGQYGQLYIFQDKRCAICRRATGATRKLSVDHDHKTGQVRGLLCRPCNDMLGHLRDDVETAARIVRYLSLPPAEHLGIVAIHEDKRKDSTE